MSPAWRADAIAGAVFGALGVHVLLEARRWDYLGPDGPGPGFFPLWYGVGIVVLSLLLVAGALRGRGGGGAPDWRGAGRALLAWAGFAACVALLEPLGFTLAFALFVAFLVGVVLRRPARVALPVALACALGFHLVFVAGLGLLLPEGPFGF